MSGSRMGNGVFANELAADEGGGSATIDSIGTGLTLSAGVLTGDLSTGKAGGQTAIGGTAASESLTLSSTSNATKGIINLGSTSGLSFNEPTGDVAIGVVVDTSYRLKIRKTGTVAIRFEGAGGGGNTTLEVGATSTNEAAAMFGGTNDVNTTIFPTGGTGITKNNLAAFYGRASQLIIAIGGENASCDIEFAPGNSFKHEMKSAGNVGWFAGAGSYGGGTKVMFFGNASAVPSSNPTAGGILYADTGALKWRGSGGTVTTIAPA